MRNKAPEWFRQLHKFEIFEFLDHFRVADEEKFCDAFMSCDDRRIREKAVQMLRDQERLWHYATQDPDPSVRSASSVMLTDDGRKLSIVWNDEDRQVKMVAAANLTDRELLSNVANTHPDYWVRKSAIGKIDHDDDLMKIVFSEKEENELRLMAARRITGEECLKKIINSAEALSAMDHHNALRDSRDVRGAAVLRIRDHGLLRSVAADYSESISVRLAAVSRLGEDDQDILEMIAARPYDPDPRRDPDLYYDPGLKAEAVAHLTDRNLLLSYLDDPERETQAAARIALGDQDLLKDTVTDWHWPEGVRRRALDRITDQDFLFGFAMNHSCPDAEERRLAAAAAKMVKDPARLKELETGALEEKVSEAAAEILYANTEKSSEYSHSVNVRRIGEIGLER